MAPTGRFPATVTGGPSFRPWERMMDIRTVQTLQADADGAMRAIADALWPGDGCRPDFLALHFGIGLAAAGLHQAARVAFGPGALHGGSSCLGVMGRDGVTLGGRGLGAFAIWDPAGSYGTASTDLGTDAAAAAAATARQALIHAGRPGEVPDLVWLTVAPGREEQVLAGLRSVLGSRTQIVGGSAADNDVAGQWGQFGPESTHSDGLVVSVLFPSAPVGTVYQSGYAPTGRKGVVTAIAGRRLFRIDDRPAAEVYAEWTEGAVHAATVAPRAILAETTLWPIGRVARHVAGVPFHIMAHPAMSHPDGSLDLFADVAEGEVLWQMRGTLDSLVGRASRVAAIAQQGAGGAIQGALVIYCGGCMMAVRDRIDLVHAGIMASLGDVPWLGIHTFGEQGALPGDQARHGNLMISCTTFGGAAYDPDHA